MRTRPIKLERGAFPTGIDRLRLFSTLFVILSNGWQCCLLQCCRFAQLCLFLVSAVVTILPAAVAQPLAKQPVALEARLEGDRSLSVLTVTLTHKVDVEIYPMQSPDRLIIDLPAVNFQIPPAFKLARTPLVKMVRYGLLGSDKARIIIDLAAPALAGRITTQMVASGFARELSIEIKSVEPSMFAKKSQEAEFTRRSTMLTNDNAVEGAVAPQTSVKGKISDRRPLIMLDPGHGGPDTGAVGLNNISEKDVVMAFARDLRSLLESRGQFRVMMTRETDVFVPLDERVRMSRLNNASLFISIHADRLATATEVHGFTVYTGSEKATDAESAILADSENRADAMAGADPVAAREDISDILDDLVRRETRSHSSLFARTLLGRMEASGQVMNKNPHRSAGFRVLRAPDLPSVLLELGYLSSKTDISKLSDAAFRERMTLDIADAVQRFFASIQAQESQGVLPH